MIYLLIRQAETLFIVCYVAKSVIQLKEPVVITVMTYVQNNKNAEEGHQMMQPMHCFMHLIAFNCVM